MEKFICEATYHDNFIYINHMKNKILHWMETLQSDFHNVQSYKTIESKKTRTTSAFDN